MRREFRIAYTVAWATTMAAAILMTCPSNVSAATYYVSAPVTNISPYRFSAIGAGTSHSLAVQTNGTVLAWGPQEFGQSNVPPNLTGVSAVAGNDFIDLALVTNGTVVAWGSSYYGYTNVPPSLNNLVAIAAQG